ncbi:MAG: SurA N-terminal domain-containing protein [Myxococcota bacterium]|jgi:peptidyl-prolyl cis-trans isomerase SurA|nr:SurA N-terminal domain-containing protein [Myxococcota bacterium]
MVTRHESSEFRRFVGFVSLLAATCVLAGATAQAEEILVDGIAAQVGDDVVLASEIEELARPTIERMREAGVPEEQHIQLRKDALERLIEGKLIAAVVKRLELTATKTEIDTAIASIAKDTGLSLGQLADSVSGYGMTFEEYREKIKGEIERSKVLSTMVRSKVQITDAEIGVLFQRRYGEQREGGEEVHLRHIMVLFDPENPMSRDIVCGEVRKAREMIVSGRARFEQVAQGISNANPETGGDLGWIHLDDLAGWMAPELLSLNAANPVSRVIEMPFGCNLLELVDRRVFQAMTLEAARPALEQELFQQKTQEEYLRWVNTLREQTYIERMGVYAASSVAEASAETP